VVRPGPNISPRSLRESAHCLRTYAHYVTELESISPILIESRQDILDAIADELCAVAEEREAKRHWYRHIPFLYRWGVR
jgi:hypothetical protein